LNETPGRTVTASRRGRGGSAKQAKIEKATKIGLLKTGVKSLYSLIAIYAGEHWVLEDYEADLVAGKMDDALETLPRKAYVYIKSYFENIAPWVALAVAIYAVTAPRIEQQAALRSARREDAFNDNGTSGQRPPGFEDEPRFAYPVAEHFVP